MPLVETESLVIKTHNLSEADKIVVLLTRDHGVVRAVAKGARRIKSRFGSSLEIFSLVSAEYFQKDSQELVSLQKADLQQSNFAAASQPEFLQKFSYFSDLIVSFSLPHDPNELLFRMMKACVEAASEPATDLRPIGLYFELWLLRLSGFLPDLGLCAGCGRTFADDEDLILRADNNVSCQPCARTGGMPMLAAAARRLVAAAWRMSPADFAIEYSRAERDSERLFDLTRRSIATAVGREGLIERTITGVAEGAG